MDGVYNMKKEMWEIENKYFLNATSQRFAKTIFHYEIFKKIAKIKGDIFELGVFKGNSLMRFVNFNEVLKAKKKFICFDDFGDFSMTGKSKDDKKFILNWRKTTGKGININSLKKKLKKKKLSNSMLIKGNVLRTLPKFLFKKQNIKISLLHLDLDVYEPTILSLNLLYNKVSKGGIILIDDYSQVKGATKATDEFIKKRNLKIERYKFFPKPCYIIK